MKTETTKVIFRTWRSNGQAIALFVQIPSDRYGYHCMSYEHIGQHSGASYDGVVLMTTLATPEQYASLKAELESIGYVLDVACKESAKDREIRHKAAEL